MDKQKILEAMQKRPPTKDELIVRQNALTQANSFVANCKLHVIPETINNKPEELIKYTKKIAEEFEAWVWRSK